MYFFSESNLVFHFVRPDAPEQEDEFQNDKAFMRNQLFSSPSLPIWNNRCRVVICGYSVVFYIILIIPQGAGCFDDEPFRYGIMTVYHHIQSLSKKIRFADHNSSVGERIGGRGSWYQWY